MVTDAKIDAWLSGEPEKPKKPKKAKDITDDDIDDFLSTPAPKVAPVIQKEVPVGTEAGGIGEAALAIGSSMVAEPVAGIAGIAGAVLPGEKGQGVRWLENTRRFIEQQPETQTGQAKLDGFSESMKNIAELPGVSTVVEGVEAYTQGARDISGMIADTNRPLAATAFETVALAGPEAALTAFGIGGAKKGVDVGRETVTRAATTTGKAIENIVETVAGKPVQIYDEAGMITPDVKDFLMQAKANGIDIDTPTKEIVDSQSDLDGLIPQEEIFDVGQMIDNYNAFVKRGVPPTKANVTQNPDDWRAQQDYIKSGGDVNDIVMNQDRRLAELARQGKAQVGPVETEIVGVNQSLYDTVVDIAETYDNAVNDAYRLARESAPTEKNIKLDDMVNTLKLSAGDETLSGGVISSVKGELKNRGVIDDKWNVVGKVDVETAEKIRQKLNQIYASNSTSGIGKDIVFGLKESLDNDVANIVGDDIFLDARRAKTDFHKVISRDKTNKWEKNSESLVNKILTGKVDPDKVFDQILKARPQDFEDIKDFYLNRSGDAGVNAWNNLKGQVFQQALDKATSGSQRGAQGDVVAQFNGTAFANVFEPMKRRRASARKGDKQTQFDAMFSKSEQELINDIIDITKLRKPSPSNPQGSGPSGFAIDRAVKGLIMGAVDKVPVLGNYVEKSAAQKAQKIEEMAERQFAFPKVLTKEQESMAKKGLK